MPTYESSALIQALTKNYQHRSQNDHRIIIDAIAPLFPTLSEKKIKFITFFIESAVGPQAISNKNYSVHSFIIIFAINSNSQLVPTLRTLKYNDVELQPNQFAIVLEYQKYLNCQSLGETSVQEELAFWQNSQYCCSMPRTKFLEIMRQAKILSFYQNQCSYVQGQLITRKESGSGVYIVRSGTFSCFKTQEKEIQAARYASGHIFGTLQFMGIKGVACLERVTTVRCTSQKGIVYHVSEQFFNETMRHYCESVIKDKQKKLIKLIPTQQPFFSKSKSLSQSINKSKLAAYNISNQLNRSNDLSRNSVDLLTNYKSELPTLNMTQVRQTASNSFYKRSTLLSKKIEEEGLRKTNYLSLRKDGPLKNYPLAAQKANYQISEFKQLDKEFINRKPSIGKPDKLLPTMSQQSHVWKRDMMGSFYRQTFYGDIRRSITKTNDLNQQ